MLRNYASTWTAIVLFALTCAFASAQAPTVTPNTCATDAARRWETVMAYQSPTPSATPTVYVDLFVRAARIANPAPVVSDALIIDVEVGNLGTGAVTETIVTVLYDSFSFQPVDVVTTTGGFGAGEVRAFSMYYQHVASATLIPLTVEVEYFDVNYLNNYFTLNIAPVMPTPSLFFEINGDTVEVKKVVGYGDLMTLRVLDRFCFGTLFLLAAFFVVYYLRGRRV